MRKINLNNTVYENFTVVRPLNGIEWATSSKGFYLDEVYSSYSNAKTMAWNYCYDLFRKDVNATNFGIRGSNTMTFTVHWNTLIETAETGELLHAYVLITRDYNRIFIER